MELKLFLHPEQKVIMRYLVLLFSAVGQLAFAQSKTATYVNDTSAYYNKLNGTSTSFDPTVNEITLKADSTFEVWSRPNVSCFTWQSYKGIWHKWKDTVALRDSYEITEADCKVTYAIDSLKRYRISFSTDKKSPLYDSEVKATFFYDFDDKLPDVERTLKLNQHMVLEIPFRDIPDRDKLASIKVECTLNTGEKRTAYLSKSNYLNKRTGDLPSVINVEVIEKPGTEIVYRTTKGVLSKEGLIVILSTTKSKTTIPDYHGMLRFETSYVVK